MIKHIDLSLIETVVLSLIKLGNSLSETVELSSIKLVDLSLIGTV
jgi:hypothetical protein